MTRDEIIRMAQEAGCNFPLRSGFGDCRVPTFLSVDGLERFANLVAAYEREEIVKSLQPPLRHPTNDAERISDEIAYALRDAIRARGTE